jgi:hypothetical protein
MDQPLHRDNRFQQFGMGVAEACGEVPTKLFVEAVAGHSQSKGRRGKKQLKSAEATAVILWAAGFNLVAAHSPKNDEWFV